MDKCFACPNKAEYILPCYHKVCDICIHDMIDGVCLHYPDETCDKQCLTSFKQDEVLLITDNVILSIEKCSIHNEPYTFIDEDDNMYCDTCSCTSFVYSIEYWKTLSVTLMEKFRNKLLNKIKGLECIIELIEYDDKSSSSIKQIEDIIDTIYVDINHIDNFNQLINNISISKIINRKNKILNSNINIQILSIDAKLKFSIIIKTIIKNDGDIHAGYDWIFRWASMNGHLAIVEYLIKNGADIHAHNDYALCWASKNCYLDLVKCLIYHGANVHANNNQSFIWACYMGHLPVVECLIYHGADVHVNKDLALRHASANGHLDACNDNALIRASENGHRNVVKYLISHGADTSLFGYYYRCIKSKITSFIK